MLTARWSHLLLLNFSVPPELIVRMAPPGTEPDLQDGQSYISIVGFRFEDARLFGIPMPGHTKFVEINLRYYVRRVVDGKLRRGVVFVNEIVPRRAVAAAANWLYHENYATRSMRSHANPADRELMMGDTVEYAWKEGRRARLLDQRTEPVWNRLAGRVAGALERPARDSFEEFIVEHYWGYAAGRDGITREYRVTHDPWRVAPVDYVVWDCNVATNYRDPWAEFLRVPPTNALVADGSEIELFSGRRI